MFGKRLTWVNDMACVADYCFKVIVLIDPAYFSPRRKELLANCAKLGLFVHRFHRKSKLFQTNAIEVAIELPMLTARQVNGAHVTNPSSNCCNS